MSITYNSEVDKFKNTYHAIVNELANPHVVFKPTLTFYIRSQKIEIPISLDTTPEIISALVSWARNERKRLEEVDAQDLHMFLRDVISMKNSSD